MLWRWQIAELAMTLAGVIFAMFVGVLPWASTLAAANTLTVTKTADTNGFCAADCSLREAIAATVSGGTVVVPAGTYTLTLGSELTVAKDLTLNDAGAASTIIQAATQPGVAGFRVLNMTVVVVAISGVTVRHGNPPSSGGGWVAVASASSVAARPWTTHL